MDIRAASLGTCPDQVQAWNLPFRSLQLHFPVRISFFYARCVMADLFKPNRLSMGAKRSRQELV
ncbi:MAG: hypothetical protein ACREV9_06625 [Burkholderiales bacterium]